MLSQLAVDPVVPGRFVMRPTLDGDKRCRGIARLPNRAATRLSREGWGHQASGKKATSEGPPQMNSGALAAVAPTGAADEGERQRLHRCWRRCETRGPRG